MEARNTSRCWISGKEEKENPYRVVGIDQKQNYGRISISGPRGNRKLTVDFLGIKGENINSWSVTERDLRVPRK